MKTMHFKGAVNFIQDVKIRRSPAEYQAFLSMLENYQKIGDLEAVNKQVRELFADDDRLYERFLNFLPLRGPSRTTTAVPSAATMSTTAPAPVVPPTATTVPTPPVQASGAPSTTPPAKPPLKSALKQPAPKQPAVKQPAKPVVPPTTTTTVPTTPVKASGTPTPAPILKSALKQPTAKPTTPTPVTVPPATTSVASPAVRQNPLGVQDALNYLDAVKERTNSVVYDQFLNIMKDFKQQRVSTTDVITAVQKLFANDGFLLGNFSIFLPPGYSVTVPYAADDSDSASSPSDADCDTDSQSLPVTESQSLDLPAAHIALSADLLTPALDVVDATMSHLNSQLPANLPQAAAELKRLLCERIDLHVSGQLSELELMQSTIRATQAQLQRLTMSLDNAQSIVDSGSDDRDTVSAPGAENVSES
eukprot:TRINITY_DN4462_c0_g2_i2.p1 TRINITY_DN4462_c0_g2~~TRINITY_DN4462_c0_g2_i2.p1  ORF type:complete len:420 (+),score=107.73 TRINITY_DN4462_c0_g2_i2:33-1292(+)